ncbi:MAG: deacetylase [Gammaproteobacteria bacterium]|jgi:acetoin utilization deacetylase AcuC-like enzyme|nr:deacetylase [Gammaproteobacteria bacterium]|tara:strand:- start:550 stop:1476 length:927 start_codon:yes stop_codon:yes gene_type:complete
MPLGIISHTDCSAHMMGEFHPEAPARMAAIQDQLVSSGLDFVVRQYDAEPIEKAMLELCHDSEYVDFVFTHSPTEGIFKLDPDTSMSPGTLRAALLAAGAAVDAVDLVMEGEISSAFCATRPPGHHAERNRAMGFCIFNNVAIAAAYAKQKYGLDRIAIVDFDVHHGNGTEDIVLDRQGYLFLSTFQHPFYPFSGTGPTPPHIVNSPLPASADSSVFRHTIEQTWIPELENFRPELLFISAGFDAHWEDEISQVCLEEQDYRWVTDVLKDIADKYSSGRIISVLEGGYALGALGRSVVAHLHGLIGRE